MTLGEKLRNLRLKTKMTLSEQGRILKVSSNSIYRWEHDIAVPRKPIIKIIADFYGVPLEWLLSQTSGSSLINETEQNLLIMFRRLQDTNRYKVLGYVERMCVEERTVDYMY
ncbi:MAG: helix-turn-helix domain-containing protein [Oscillospiraceae bacterium]|jgi:transcriptional regulator with XRE-family HTH domain|nr:helix-turn-helix domain-containing protein [Oscillospiraceae bacterium]